MESRHLFGLSAVLLVAIFLSGCAMEPTKISEHLPPPPNATIGPEMQLLKIPTSTDDIASAVLDKLGKAHVIIAAERLKEVSYVVIGANGVLSSQVMLTHVTPNSIDLAFDREGRLHALIDDEHLMLKDGHWIGQLRTPWKEAGVHPVWGEPQFVKGAPDLTWAFYLGGSDLNLGRRFGVVGEANLAFPVMTKVIKLVVVPEEAPYKHWNAVGMEDNSDIQPHAKVMADGKMNIYVAYVPTADFKSYEYYYASFCANCDCPKPVPEPRTKPKSEAQEAYNHYNTERKYNLAPKLPNGTSACAIEGVPLGKMAADAMKYYRSIRNKDVAINWGDLPGMSVDPQTGDILLVTRVGTALDRNGTWGGFSQQPITNVQFFLAPAGQDRYHALALGTLKSPVTVNSKSAGLTNMETPIAVDYAHPLYYLAYSNGKWSAPIKIGSHDLFSKGQNPFVPPKNELTEAIASDDHGHALLIWPTRDAIVGRWITLN